MGVYHAPHPSRFAAQIDIGRARGRAGRHKLGTVELIRPDRRDDHGRTLAHRTQAGRLGGIRLNQRQIVWCADVGTHLLELVGRASRDRPGRSIVAAIGRRQIFGDETASVTRRAIDDEVEVPLHDVGPPRDPGEVSSDPCAIAGHEDAQHEQYFIDRPIAFDGGYHSSCLRACNVRLGGKPEELTMSTCLSR